MKRNQTVFITGMSGYLGGALCRELDALPWCKRFFGMDIKRPLAKYHKGEFRLMDITDSRLVQWVKEVNPDILIHLAFVLAPIHDGQKMARVNVGGMRNVLMAIAEAQVPQTLIASSATAYGAYADNPVPLTENHPIRRHPSFAYAREKAEVESLCEEFMAQHPDVAMSVIRPCMVFGPRVDNYLFDLFTMPLAVVPKKHAARFQFVHEDDLVGAALAILAKEGRGAFNVAPPDTVGLEEIYRQTGKKPVALPGWMIRRMLDCTWKTGIPLGKAPAALYDFLRYPWIVDASRLTESIGYNFVYSSKETLDITLKAKHILRVAKPVPSVL